MTIHFDEKGKIFTNIVSKDAIPATIQCLTYTIRGLIHVKQGERIKDELDNNYQFLPVTNACMYDPEGNILYRTSFLAVNRNHIIWLIPDADINNHENTSGESS